MSRLKVLFWLLLLAVLLSIVGDNTANSATAAQTAANPECQLSRTLSEPGDQCRIQIGVINSFTDGSGGCFDGGIEHKQGYELALADIDGVLGCQVELVAVDDGGNNQRARAAVTTLADAGVPLIIGAYSSGATLEAAAEANTLGIPLLVPSASSDLITSVGYEWVFRINATSEDYVTEALALTATLAESPSVGVIYENTVFGESAAVAIVAQAEELGISIVSYIPFQPGVPTAVADAFDAKLAFLSGRIRETRPDVIFLISNNITDALGLLKISRLEALNPQLYIGVAGAFLSPNFLQQSGDEVENLVATAQWSADVAQSADESSNVERFISNFQTAYPEQMPGMRSVQTYTALLLAAEAVSQASSDLRCERAGSTLIRECIRDFLRANAWEQTLFGPVDFDDVSGQNAHQVLLVQAKKDEAGYRFVTIYPEAYQTQPLTLETTVSDR